MIERESRFSRTFVSGWTRTVRSLRAIANNTISLIKERRSALITASVTGEIDVQGGVALNAQAK